MRIVINALSARRGGGQTYIINLLKNLEGFNGDKIYILSQKSLKIQENEKIEHIRIKWSTENPLMRTIWEKLCLPNILRKLKADILFCPGGVVSTNPPNNCKIVTMFRNMIPFDIEIRKRYPLGLMRVRNWILEKVMIRSLLKADLVIFISEFAKQLIDERTGFRLKKTVVIPHGINTLFRNSKNKKHTRPKWLPNGEYFMYVSIFDVYKNQREVVKAYHLLKKRGEVIGKLVLAGHNKSSYGKSVLQEIYKMGLQNDIICPGEVNYLELPEAYYYSKLNIFASQCENCPNILLEALGAGQPLLVSETQPMPEFGGNAVIYFDASSPEDLVDKISSILSDENKIKQMSLKSIERSNEYTWDKTASRTWDEIENLL